MGIITAIPPIPRHSTTKDKVNRLYYLAKDDPKAINDSYFNDVLHEVIGEFNDYLKELEFPVKGAVLIRGARAQYTSDEELDMINKFKTRLNTRIKPILEHYYNAPHGLCIPEVFNALHDIKMEEINNLNKHLKYKVDPDQVCV